MNKLGHPSNFSKIVTKTTNNGVTRMSLKKNVPSRTFGMTHFQLLRPVGQSYFSWTIFLIAISVAVSSL